MKKVLVVTPSIPRPDIASGDKRFRTLLQMLARHQPIDLFAYDGNAAKSPFADYLPSLAGDGINVPKATNLHGILAGARYKAAFCEFYDTTRYLLQRFRLAEPQSPVITDSVDIHFAREESGDMLLHGKITPETAHRKGLELAVYRESQTVVTITAEDDVLLKSAVPGLRTLIIPNIIPIRPRELVGRTPSLVFVGGFGHPPNIDGILWFVRECWASIKAAVPETTLAIVGNKPPAEVLDLGKLPGITVTGHVPEVAPYLDAAAVSVAPLRYGGGMKGKVTEALSFGLPVVTTAFGAQGFGATPGVHLAVHDDAPGFAQACIGLLRSPESARKMGLAGQKLVADICSPEAVASKVKELAALMDQPRNGPPRWATRPAYFIFNSVRPK